MTSVINVGPVAIPLTQLLVVTTLLGLVFLAEHWSKRHDGGDGAWVWLALLSTWGSDTLAYFVGRAIGQHKLWPRHSPKKTWEGLFGGIAGGIIGAAIVAAFSDLGWTTALIIGAIIPVAGLFGDLSISMMKRHVGVKDSSNLFPGHGGFLDRIDSLLFVSVVTFYYAVWSGVFGL